MTLSSVARRFPEAARTRDLRTPGITEGRSGSAYRPKTDKG
jgi:hypothetical protein